MCLGLEWASWMKILHLINTLAVGGAELHLLTLSKQLRRSGAEVVVSCLGERAKGSRSLRRDFEDSGIPVISLGAESRWDWGFLGRIPLLLRQEQPDVLHTHLPRADLAGLIGHLVSPSVPWVCSVHGHSNSWSGRRVLPVFNYIWRQPNVVVAISQEIKDWLVKARRIPAGKVEVVYYGIDPERFASHSEVTSIGV